MTSPFVNDVFGMVWKAFKNLYPDKDCKCFWSPDIRDTQDGEKCLGLTDFNEESGEVTVFIKPTIPVVDALEIFAHELAHVAVGVKHDHDAEWEKAFDNIFNEYNRLGDEMFPCGDKAIVEVTDGKAYRK